MSSFLDWYDYGPTRFIFPRFMMTSQLKFLSFWCHPAGRRAWKSHGIHKVVLFNYLFIAAPNFFFIIGVYYFLPHAALRFKHIKNQTFLLDSSATVSFLYTRASQITTVSCDHVRCMQAACYIFCTQYNWWT